MTCSARPTRPGPTPPATPRSPRPVAPRPARPAAAHPATQPTPRSRQPFRRLVTIATHRTHRAQTSHAERILPRPAGYTYDIADLYRTNLGSGQWPSVMRTVMKEHTN